MNNIYSYFGGKVARQEALGMILHTRAATTTKGIENTHPFVDNEVNPNVAIIHNGMIQNHLEFAKKYGTCDSEVIAHMYDEHKVNEDFNNLQTLFDQFKGWLTVCALSKIPSVEPGKTPTLVMDLFTDGRRLKSYFVPELDTRVYCTLAEDIEEVAKLFNYTVKDGRSFNAYTGQRINVLTGDVMEAKNFTRITKQEPRMLNLTDAQAIEIDMFNFFFNRGESN